MEDKKAKGAFFSRIAGFRRMPGMARLDGFRRMPGMARLDGLSRRDDFRRIARGWLALTILLLAVAIYASLASGSQSGWLGFFSLRNASGVVILAVVTGIGLVILLAALGTDRGVWGKKLGEENPQRVAGQAEDLSQNVRKWAQKEAEAQAARILAEARQQAQEIITGSRRRAEAASQQEADDILQAARIKAEGIEERARQQAVSFLTQAREQIVEDISLVNDIWAKEVKQVYFRLFASFQELIGEVERIEGGWRSRSMELLKGRGLELKEFQPFASLASEVPELLSERGEVESEAVLLEEV